MCTPYPRLTRADPLSGGPDRHWTSSSSSVGGSPPSSSSSPEPIIVRRKVLRSFSGAEAMVSEADEAAGLTPGNEENEAERCFSPEKPCLPLSIEGFLPNFVCSAPSPQAAEAGACLAPSQEFPCAELPAAVKAAVPFQRLRGSSALPCSRIHFTTNHNVRQPFRRNFPINIMSIFHTFL